MAKESWTTEVHARGRVELFRVEGQVLTVDLSHLEKFATPREVFEVGPKKELGNISLFLEFDNGSAVEWIDAEIWDKETEKVN